MQGFAARGTTVSDRLRTYRQLIEKTDVWPSHWTRRGNSVVSDGQRNNSSVIVDESNDGDDLNNGVENGSGDEEAPDIGVETYFCGIPSE